MTIIPQNQETVSTVLLTIMNFFSEYKINSLLRKCNADKLRGVSPTDIFYHLFTIAFEDRSMYRMFVTGTFKGNCSKNTMYRFLRSVKTNWLRFTSLLASAVISRSIMPLTSADRVNVFIVDDSTYERHSYKKRVPQHIV